MKYKTTLFIFRRDLRIEDNTGLSYALEHSEQVIPCFIFDPAQVENNPYRSDHCLQFMIESLEDLQNAIRLRAGALSFFSGSPAGIIEKCMSHLQVDAVIVNKDYTPFSIERDKAIETVCQTHQCVFYAFEDALLHPPETLLKRDGTPYTVFTPFYRNALPIPVMPPHSPSKGKFASECLQGSIDARTLFKKVLPLRCLEPCGGRSRGLEILSHITSFARYAAERDFPALNHTTHLSPHLKFTTCSIREVYWAIYKTFGRDSELIRSLFWRDFFTSISYYFPRVFSGPFKEQFASIIWNNDQHLFKRWCVGKTGVPLVDAGMRELNSTGFMHNRVRMVAASFLVKDLLIDWRWGEKYFAQQLIDYDPAVNNGNWQWVASTGCDAQPYFRIFNPWNQSAKFDPDCTYIKKWIPELAAMPPKTIHTWHSISSHAHNTSYPSPIVDHATASKEAVARWRT